MARSCSLLYRREQSNVMKLIYSNRRYYHVSLIEDGGVESRGFPNDTERAAPTLRGSIQKF